VTKDELRVALRGAGLRATPQRLAVLGMLSKSTVPLSHGDIADRLATAAAERSTIYRNIIALARAGLVHRTGRDTAWRFAIARDVPHARAHPHFVCKACGRVSCLEATDVKVRRSDLPGAMRRGDFEIQIHGVCDDCASARPS
jgi:Fur family ferric uptake transcriptional regulator